MEKKSELILKRLFLSVILIFLTECTIVSARRKRDKSNFQFKDCGKDPYRPVIFSDLKLSPIPIVTPGTLYVTMAGNLTYDLPRRISIKLEVTKYWIGIPFVLPCFNNQIGSCMYENICANLETYEKRRRCPRRLRSYNLQCYCPFHAGEFNLKKLAINVPKIGGFAGALVKGDYGVVIRLLDENHDELGCVDLRLTMKKRNKGWLFRI